MVSVAITDISKHSSTGGKNGWHGYMPGSYSLELLEGRVMMIVQKIPLWEDSVGFCSLLRTWQKEKLQQ